MMAEQHVKNNWMRARINLIRWLDVCILNNIIKTIVLVDSTTTCHTEIAMMIPSFLKYEEGTVLYC